MIAPILDSLFLSRVIPGTYKYDKEYYTKQFINY